MHVLQLCYLFLQDVRCQLETGNIGSDIDTVIEMPANARPSSIAEVASYTVSKGPAKLASIAATAPSVTKGGLEGLTKLARVAAIDSSGDGGSGVDPIIETPAKANSSFIAKGTPNTGIEGSTKLACVKSSISESTKSLNFLQAPLILTLLRSLELHTSLL